MKTRFALSILLALALLALTNLRAQTTEPTSATSDGPIFKNVSDLKWDKIIPDLGENSPEICFLRVDPTDACYQPAHSHLESDPRPKTLAYR